MPKPEQLTGLGVELSRDAKRRLEWIEWYRAHGSNARRTCRHFSILPDTFYRWLRRQTSYDLAQVRKCEDRVRVERYRPSRTRQARS